jgi:hypothetical protein
VLAGRPSPDESLVHRRSKFSGLGFLRNRLAANSTRPSRELENASTGLAPGSCVRRARKFRCGKEPRPQANSCNTQEVCFVEIRSGALKRLEERLIEKSQTSRSAYEVSQAKTLLLASDYGGEHGGSRYLSYSFVLVDLSYRTGGGFRSKVWAMSRSAARFGPF